MNRFQLLFSDFKYSLRTFRKNPGFTAIIILILALGTGANTAIFTTIYAVLIRPLPYPDADSLVQLWEVDLTAMSELKKTSVSNLIDWTERNRTLEGIAAAARPSSITLTSAVPSEEIRASFVTTNFFSIMKTRAYLGRTFIKEEQEKPSNAVVISHGFWKSHFGGEQNVNGKRIHLDQENYEIVGVLPEEFKNPSGPADVWIPITIRTSSIDRGQNYLQAFGRLKKDITVEQAQADLDSLAATLAKQYPSSNSRQGIAVIPMQKQITSSIRQPLMILSIAVMLVLLVCCSNVSNLLMIRAFDRKYEYTVRMVLGASHGRIVSQILTENLVLFLTGGAVGVVFAKWILRLFLLLEPGMIPSLMSIHFGNLSFIYAFLMTTFTGLLFGAIPSIQFRKPQMVESLRSGKTIQQRIGEVVRQSLTIGQIALSFILVVSAALLVQSFLRLQNAQPGFQPQNLLVAEQGVDGPRYKQPADKAKYYQRLIQELKEIPGVTDAAAATVIPMGNFGIDFEVPYSKDSDPLVDLSIARQASFHAVTAEYFRTLQVPLLEGRYFSEEDDSSKPLAVIINKKLAEQVWPGQSISGKKLRFFWADWQTYNVIGVVANTKSFGLQSDATPELYVSHKQIPYSVMNVLIRFKQLSADSPLQVQQTFLKVDSQQPLQGLTTMQQLCDQSIQRERFVATLTMSFAILSLVLAIAGVYGTISFDTIRRTREIGLRMALGATRGKIRIHILRRGILVMIGGLVIGIFASLGTSILLKAFLFGIEVNHPMTFGLVAAILMAIGLLACLLPANRASSVDPNIALHCE